MIVGLRCGWTRRYGRRRLAGSVRARRPGSRPSGNARTSSSTVCLAPRCWRAWPPGTIELASPASSRSTCQSATPHRPSDRLGSCSPSRPTMVVHTWRLPRSESVTQHRGPAQSTSVPTSDFMGASPTRTGHGRRRLARPRAFPRKATGSPLRTSDAALRGESNERSGQSSPVEACLACG